MTSWSVGDVVLGRSRVGGCQGYHCSWTGGGEERSFSVSGGLHVHAGRGQDRSGERSVRVEHVVDFNPCAVSLLGEVLWP